MYSDCACPGFMHTDFWGSLLSFYQTTQPPWHQKLANATCCHLNQPLHGHAVPTSCTQLQNSNSIHDCSNSCHYVMPYHIGGGIGAETGVCSNFGSAAMLQPHPNGWDDNNTLLWNNGYDYFRIPTINGSNPVRSGCCGPVASATNLQYHPFSPLASHSSPGQTCTAWLPQGYTTDDTSLELGNCQPDEAASMFLQNRSSNRKSGSSSSNDPREDWTRVANPANRKSIQNRIAQRIYRKKHKRSMVRCED